MSRHIKVTAMADSHAKWLSIFFALLASALLSGCGQPTAESRNSPLNSAPTEPLARGQYLAKAANCAGCHTPLGQAPFSGGRAIPTPFGEVISSNLTADPETGIGQWTSDDFWQALHHGKSRDGRSLYPAFPYPSYSQITRDDSDALFVYLQSLKAVKNLRPEHRLRFPYNSQWALNIWRALYFKPAAFSPEASQSESWNRGAYLVKGLGHCGACHTARGTLGNSDHDHPLAGASIDELGWDAPSLANGPLTAAQQEQMVKLLKTGINARDVMSGPMAEVVAGSLQHLTHQDLAAMVEYLASLPATSQTVGTAKAPDKERLQLGLSVYEKHCSDCHGADGEGEAYRYPALAGNRNVTAASPRNAIRSLMFGGFGASTADRPRPYGMPSYAQQLSDREAAAVLSYIRNAWGNTAPLVRPSAIRQR